ncbi:MAG: N-formylglutamate amidohydrolase [Gammaproteobacteria bacterium]|nr:N-formylglutamate amidohydrolase [Gammaproteobacteria bacterium]
MTKLVESLISNEPAAVIANADGNSEVVLICEHAGRELPEFIGSLDVDDEVMSSHIAWDLGAAELSRQLSEILDAPLIMQRYSRLLYDCNRSFDAVDAIVEESDDIFIPGNAGLSKSQRQQRHDIVYLPFFEAIKEIVESRIATGLQPVIVTIHSFTPVYKGQQRTVELGVLHDTDSRLADNILSFTQEADGYRAARNEPYSAEDGVTHTLMTHGVKNQLPNVMFEIRNDLLGDNSAREIWARRLGSLINQALESLGE